MNYWNKALLAIWLMMGAVTAHAVIIEGPINDSIFTSTCSSTSVSCTASEVPSESYSILSELLAEYSIGDIVSGLEIVGYIAEVYCDPSSSIIDSRSGTTLTGNVIVRQNSRVIDSVWSGEAAVHWYQEAMVSVPEPSTIFLLAIGLVGFFGKTVRCKKCS
jgi:hypothetical protein